MANPAISDDKREAIRQLHLAGKMAPEIALLVGVSKAAVHRHRRAMGLEVITLQRFRPTPEQVEQLRTTSDRAMERLHGNHASTWGRIRVRHRIPRFRAPTSGPDYEPKPPAPPKLAKVTKLATVDNMAQMWQAPIPPRDHSLAGEAASFLRRERWVVVNREKVYRDKGKWDVGRMRMTTAEMIAMAKRKGFCPQSWMGVAA